MRCERAFPQWSMAKVKLSGLRSKGKGRSRPRTNSSSSNKQPSHPGSPKGTPRGTPKKVTPLKGSVAVADTTASKSTAKIIAPPLPAAEPMTNANTTQSMETDYIDDAIVSILTQTVQPSSETAMAAMSQESTDIINIDDLSDGFKPVEGQDHTAMQQKARQEKCAKEKAEKDVAQKKAGTEKATIESTIIGNSVRSGALLLHMFDKPMIPEIPGRSYGQYAVPRIPKSEESDSGDDEIMNSYAEQVCSDSIK